MRHSLFYYMGANPNLARMDEFVDDIRALHEQGFRDFWVPQLPWEGDILVSMALALHAMDDITMTTGVLPIQARHPMTLAQVALTLSSVSGGRFRLGIGMTHAMISEGMLGIPWDRPARRLNEYLDGLLPLLAGKEATLDGEIYTAKGRIKVPGASAPPVYIAALGPQLLKIAGRRAAGTFTWMVGPRTLAAHVVPSITAAASEAGRSAEVVMGLPICITDDVSETREHATKAYAMYGGLQSYRAMLDREGVAGPADVALIGDEKTVAGRLEEIAAAGVAEFSANVFGRGQEDVARTHAFLSGLG